MHRTTQLIQSLEEIPVCENKPAMMALPLNESRIRFWCGIKYEDQENVTGCHLSSRDGYIYSLTGAIESYA